jgi:hypothetical protein
MRVFDPAAVWSWVVPVACWVASAWGSVASVECWAALAWESVELAWESAESAAYLVVWVS